MTPEERDTIIAYVSEVENFANLSAHQIEGLKRLLIEKGLMTPEQLDEAIKTFETTGAMEEALDPQFQALNRLRRWLEEQK